MARLIGNNYFIPSTFGLILFGLWIGTRDVKARKNNQRAAICTALSLALVTVFVQIAYLVYQRPRPFIAHEVNLLIPPPQDPSFPSNSTAVAFAIALAVWLQKRFLGNFLLIPAFLVALSRIYLGVHYPSDILGGMVFSLISSLVSFYLLRWFSWFPDSIIKKARKIFLA